MIVQFQRLLLFLLTTIHLIFNYKISKFMEYLELIRLGHYAVPVNGILITELLSVLFKSSPFLYATSFHFSNWFDFHWSSYGQEMAELQGSSFIFVV